MNKCLICHSETTLHESLTVRQKHPASLLRCLACGFAFFNKPTWIAEAYEQPINIADTGYVHRNVNYKRITAAFIKGFLNVDGCFLDYGAGYGLLVRLMRDQGFDFRWHDTYTENLFARGFDWTPGQTAELATAFEVFEHIVDPRTMLAELSAITDSILFSTELQPTPLPCIKDWWYYAPTHGQHVSFYTKSSLTKLGEEFGYELLTDGIALHWFSRKRQPRKALAFAKSRWFQRLQDHFHRRPPLMWADHCSIQRRIDAGELQA